MIIDLNKLINNYIEEVLICEQINLNKEYLVNTKIKDLGALEVKGSIFYTTFNRYSLNITVKGNMILDTNNKKEENYSFNIKINEILSKNDLDEEYYIKITENSIDIMPIIWQNIIMEIPLQRLIKKNKEGD